VVYGPDYDDRKVEFIDELHKIIAGWQGPIIIGGVLICVDKHMIKLMVE
jgi:hypothetical protein